MTEITPAQYNDANYLREIICSLEYEEASINVCRGQFGGSVIYVDIGPVSHEDGDIIKALHGAYVKRRAFDDSEAQRKIQARQNALNKLTPEEIVLLGIED